MTVDAQTIYCAALMHTAACSGDDDKAAGPYVYYFTQECTLQKTFTSIRCDPAVVSVELISM